MIDRIPEIVLYAALMATVLYHLPRKAGGWRGLLHRQVRVPAAAVPIALLAIVLGSRMSEAVGEGVLPRGFADLGGVMVFVGVIGSVVLAGTVLTRLNARQQDLERITEELDLLLDPTDTHFVVDASNAHRPLDLLNELSQLIGPGHHAPGQPWATHQWIAERMPAARALKPNTAEPRIEKPVS